MRDSLIHLIRRLAELPDGATIYAAHPWTDGAVGTVANWTEPPPDLAYLLEVELAKDVIEAWSEWRNGQVPSDHEACQAVIYDAEHDAYEPVE